MSQIFIGGLSDEIRKSDLERKFKNCGRMKDVWIVRDFGFIQFEDPRDADDAIRDMDGEKICGRKIRVERSRGGMKGGGGGGGFGGGKY